MLGKAYIKNKDIYVLFDKTNIGERTGIIYPLGYHITNFTTLDINRLKEEYIKMIDYTLSTKFNIDDYFKNLSLIVDNFDKYSPYLHYYTQKLINNIFDALNYLKRTQPLYDTYKLLNLNKYTYNSLYDVKIDCLSFLDVILNDINNSKNKLIEELEFLQNKFEDLNPMEKLYLIDYNRKLLGKTPYYTENYFTSAFEPSKIFIKKYVNKDNIINEFKNKTVEIVETFILYNSDDLIRFELIQVVKNNIKINKCNLCNNYFIPLGRNDTLYCNRIYKNQNKTCNQIGARLKYIEKNKENPIHIQYEKAYRRMYSKQRRNVINKKQFFNWTEKSKNLRNKCINNEISFDEFLIFLNSDKIKPTN